MSLDNIIGGFTHYQRLQSPSQDDDWVDHLNHIYTVIILVIFAIFVSGKQYVGNPIECFSEDVPLSPAKREYARSYCWLHNTYRVPDSVELPVGQSDRSQSEIQYYQWVPIILLVMAILFKLPNLIWRLTSYSCGLDLTKIATLVSKSQMMTPEQSKDTLLQMTNYLDRWLSSNHLLVTNHGSTAYRYWATYIRCGCFWGKGNGTYLTGLYLLTKFLFLSTSVSIFFLLWHVLGKWYLGFGLMIMSGASMRMDGASGHLDMVSEDSERAALQQLPYFPKLTFCDFSVRQQNNINTHTLQCALPINMFNEKIFSFLWFWIIIVTAINGVNFMMWLYKFQFGTLRGSGVCQLLENHGDLITDYDRILAAKFGHKYLGRDGCFVMEVVQKNSNVFVTGDLVSQLFRLYRQKVTVKKEKGCGDIMYI